MKHILNDIFTLYIQKRENQPLSEIEKAEKEKEIESYQKSYETLSDNQKNFLIHL